MVRQCMVSSNACSCFYPLVFSQMFRLGNLCERLKVHCCSIDLVVLLVSERVYQVMPVRGELLGGGSNVICGDLVCDVG